MKGMRKKFFQHKLILLPLLLPLALKMYYLCIPMCSIAFFVVLLVGTKRSDPIKLVLCFLHGF